MTAYPFLSDEWIDAARALRADYADRAPAPPVPVKMNLVITEIPHRSGDLEGRLDSSDGQVIIEQGHLDEPELTVTVDYDTARAAFVDRDQQAVMQAFLSGKIYVEGDASRLLALQSGPPEPDPVADEVFEKMQAFTAKD